MHRRILAAVLGIAAATLVFGQEDDLLPRTYSGNLRIVNMPSAMSGSRTAFLRMTIERWSTDEERLGFARALRDDGAEGLYRALEGTTVGYLQIDQNLRWPVRIASRFATDDGLKIRLVTNRPVLIEESRSGSRSLEYPIGIVEFVMPDGGKPGQGALLAATRPAFNDQGQLEVTSMPHQTDVQEVSGVRLEKPRGSRKSREPKD
ncbi:MAG: hypothetical protein PVF68_16670 [Acidobacteriota bacterium]|jgi:hypothetical protein